MSPFHKTQPWGKCFDAKCGDEYVLRWSKWRMANDVTPQLLVGQNCLLKAAVNKKKKHVFWQCLHYTFVLAKPQICTRVHAFWSKIYLYISFKGVLQMLGAKGLGPSVTSNKMAEHSPMSLASKSAQNMQQRLKYCRKWKWDQQRVISQVMECLNWAVQKLEWVDKFYKHAHNLQQLAVK